MKNVVIITGASSGMGKSTAEILVAKGYTVYGAARRIEKMKDLEALGVNIIQMDLTEDDSIVNAVNTVLDKENRIDILINNAGYGSYGSVEDVSLEEARRQFEVNMFGLARITQLVLPTMRKQNSGRIVNITSIGGKIYTPMGAWYHATKHAVEGWSDCLRLEVKKFGIEVVIVEPGGIDTEWGGIAMDSLTKTSQDGAYQDFAEKVTNAMHSNHSKNLTKVEVLGKVIAKAATENNPKIRYLNGYMAKPMILIRKLFGDRFYDLMILTLIK